MSDDKGGGLLSGLILGAGLAGIVLAPFYLARQFGRVPMAAFTAVLMTVLAIFSPELVAMAKELDACCRPNLATVGAQVILALDVSGFWALAGLVWATLIALILLSVLFQAPADGDDAQPN